MTSEADEILRRQRTIDSLNRLLAEIEALDMAPPVLPLYPQPDSVNETIAIRVGIAMAGDSLEQALANWHVYRLTRNWSPVRQDLISAASYLVRMIRDIA